MDIKQIAELITEDPDVFNEIAGIIGGKDALGGAGKEKPKLKQPSEMPSPYDLPATDSLMKTPLGKMALNNTKFYAIYWDVIRRVKQEIDSRPDPMKRHAWIKANDPKIKDFLYKKMIEVGESMK